jgi:hypothetical protein
MIYQLPNQDENQYFKIPDVYPVQVNFKIWPPEWEMKPGESVKIMAGIRNNAQDSQMHSFVINVIPLGSTRSIMLDEFMSTWVTFERTLSTAEFQSEVYKNITIELPMNAQAGHYFFSVMACYDKGGESLVSSECTPESENLWSEPEYIMISVIES